MSYPGNDSLSQELRQRVLETYRQTLELARRGNRREASLGCDFILRLDPLFEPARALQERLKGEGDIELEDLESALASAAAPQAAPAAGTADALFGDDEPQAAAPAAEIEADDSGLDELDLDLSLPQETKDDIWGESEPEPEPAATTPTEMPGTPPAAETPSGTATAETQSGLDSEPIPPELPADYEEPSVALDSESAGRIDELLAEGQSAFDDMSYQAAIDAWSRIFLIDIDHPEANRRIELARKLKAEVERTVDEAFHEGVAKVEKGALAEARLAFEKVLDLQPNHMNAREYLDRLDGGGAGAPAPATEQPPTGAAEDPSLPAAIDIPPPPSDGDDLLSEELSEEVMVPPSPAAPAGTPAASGPMIQGRKSEPRGKLLVYIGSAVLLLVLVGGWFLYSNWERMFPNANEVAAPTETGPDPIARAKKLQADGNTSIAVAQLRRLAPDDPLYAEAQALISEWESTPAGTPDEPVVDPRVQQRLDLIADATAAHADGRYLDAENLFARAAAIEELDGRAAALLQDSSARLDPLRNEIEIFRQGEWEFALRELWRLREQDPRNPTINALMIDCYYNLGVRALQRGDTETAAKHFGEALELGPRRVELARLRDFATTYQRRPQDLLYRIFVKYLRFR